MAILVITADLQCCRCKKKIQRVLECLKEEYCIEKIEYEDKMGKVIVRGQFDAEKLCKKIWCKACKTVKEIKIVDVWPPPKPCPPEPPKPCPPEPPKPKPPPTPPKPVYKLVPYPYPVPYPMQCQSSPWDCPPQQCYCCPKPPPSPPPRPPSPPPRPPSPPKPKPCECSQSHHRCGCGSKPAPPPPCSCSHHGSCGCGKPPMWPPVVWPPQQPFCPPPWSEENPPDACSTM